MGSASSALKKKGSKDTVEASPSQIILCPDDASDRINEPVTNLEPPLRPVVNKDPPQPKYTTDAVGHQEREKARLERQRQAEKESRERDEILQHVLTLPVKTFYFHKVFQENDFFKRNRMLVIDLVLLSLC